MTKTFALAFTAAAALLISAGAVAADAPTSPPMPTIVGGWSALAPGNTELRAVARFVVPRLGRRHARLQRIESGERQVVAGTNYRIVLRLRDRTRWRAQVWHKLDGSYEMTSAERVR